VVGLLDRDGHGALDVLGERAGPGAAEAAARPAHAAAEEVLEADGAAAAAAPAAAEQLLEEVGEVPGVEAAADVAGVPAAGRRRGRRPVGAVGVVDLALLGVGEHLVGLVDVLEDVGGLRVVLVAVGVVLAGELAVGLLDVVLVGAPGDAEGLVVVLERHGVPPFVQASERVTVTRAGRTSLPRRLNPCW
jgi:hypothetical protein